MTLSSILNELEQDVIAGLTAAEQAIVKLLQEGGSDALAFVTAAAKSIEQNGGAVLMSAAQQAVTAAATTNGTASDKFNSAVTAVTGTLQDAGLTVVKNAVNIGVEAAVANQKALTTADTQ